MSDYCINDPANVPVGCFYYLRTPFCEGTIGEFIIGFISDQSSVDFLRFDRCLFLRSLLSMLYCIA